MSLTITLVPFQLSPTEEWTVAKFNQGFNPTISFTGSVGTADLAAGAVTAAKATPGAYFYAAATGTDTYVADFDPGFSALVNGLQVWVKFANANATTTPTLNAESLGAKKIRHRGDVALRAGDLPANCLVSLVYNTSLDSGTGGWELQGTLENYTAVVAASRNLICTNGSNPDTQADIDADEVVLKNSAGEPYLASTVNLTVTITDTGANGLEDGTTEANSTWYYLWVIYNPTTATVAGLISASSTAPTLPSGYTFKALVGVVRNLSTGNFWLFWQNDRRVYHGEMVVFNNQAGNSSNLTTLSISDYVPPIARRATGSFGRSAGAGGGGMQIAGSQTVGIQIHNGAIGAAAANSFYDSATFDIPMVTSQTLFWAGATTDAVYRLVISGIWI